MTSHLLGLYDLILISFQNHQLLLPEVSCKKTLLLFGFSNVDVFFLLTYCAIDSGKFGGIR